MPRIELSEPIEARSARSRRLIVEPHASVGLSVLPGEADDRAAAEAGGAAVPLEPLARFGAAVRQPHRRANVVVIEVPPDRQAALAGALRDRGLAVRPPLPIRAVATRASPRSTCRRYGMAATAGRGSGPRRSTPVSMRAIPISAIGSLRMPI